MSEQPMEPSVIARVLWLCVGLPIVGLIDAWREQRDIAEGRTHLTGTTLSASVRWVVAEVDRRIKKATGVPRAGTSIFTAACIAVPLWFHGHVLRHLDNRKANQ